MKKEARKTQVHEYEHMPYKCPICQGRGVTGRKTCSKCNGIGIVYS